MNKLHAVSLCALTPWCCSVFEWRVSMHWTQQPIMQLRFKQEHTHIHVILPIFASYIFVLNFLYWVIPLTFNPLLVYFSLTISQLVRAKICSNEFAFSLYTNCDAYACKYWTMVFRGMSISTLILLNRHFLFYYT